MASQIDSTSQTHTSALKVDTITYGIPMMIALSVATRADTVLIKIRAVVLGLFLMLLVNIPFVMIWAKMTSLQLEEQIAISGSRGSRSTFLYYLFHGYAFSQPVVVVGIWLGMLLLGAFKARPKENQETPTVARNAPCPCGSGRKYKRCCGRSS